MKTTKKIFKILDKNEKKNFIILIFLAQVVALVDVTGIASVLPFVTVLSNPEIIESNYYIKKLYEFSYIFGIKNYFEFKFFFGVSIIIFFSFSICLKIFSNYLYFHFCSMREYSIGKRLIKKILTQKYIWFLDQKSSDTNKKILNEIQIVIYETLIPYMTFVTQASLSFLIILFIIFIDPLVAFNVGLVLSFSYLLIFFSIKKKLNKLNDERFYSNTLRFKILFEIVNSIKYIKMSNLENFFINKFNKHSKINAKSMAYSRIFSHLPRYLMEGIAFGGMTFLTLILLKKHSNFINILPLIGLYIFSAYRLIPALQQMYAAAAQIKFSSSALNNLYSDIINLKENPNTNEENKLSKNKNGCILKFEKSIQLKNIKFLYPKSSKPILKNINIEISKSQKIGIVGMTGSGKTTLVDIMIGLLDSNYGDLIVDDVVINEQNKYFWQKKIGYVPQEIVLNDSTIFENITFGSEDTKINNSFLDKINKIACIDEFIDNLANGINTLVGERGTMLSGGQKQRIGIARSLYNNPSFLVMDEATSALDNIIEKRVVNNLINNFKELTVIMITHKVNNLDKFDQIYLIQDGEIKDQGTFQYLLKNNNFFKKLHESSE